jgi:hypothetical protein
LTNITNPRADAPLSTAGMTLFALFVGSVILLFNSSFDTLSREAAITVQNFTAWLELLWMAVAIGYAVVRWRKSSIRFRVFFVLNGLVVALLLAELFAAVR